MANPTSDPFDAIRHKLRRAHVHTYDASKLAERFLQSDPYGFAAKGNRKSGVVIFRVTHIDPMPHDVSLMIGDAAHCIRTALDHLMFLLAKPKTENAAKKVSFPIVAHLKDWKGVAYKMPGVARGVRTLVESLQPYHSRKWPDTALLGQIQAIDNWDKHRHLATTAVMLENSRLEIESHGRVTVLGYETFRRRFKANAVFARVQLGPGDVGDQVHVKPVFVFSPVFDDGMPKQFRRKQVIQLLIDANRFIENDVLPSFAKFF